MIPAAAYLQAEASECGLACLGYAAAKFGSVSDLGLLRQQFPTSSRGSTLSDLIEIAAALHLSGRAVRCDLEEMRHLQAPAVLHWRMNHFVVLLSLNDRRARIFDPSAGERTVTKAELDRQFSGVALELSPAAGFVKRRDVRRLRLDALVRWRRAWLGPVVQTLLLSVLMQVYVLASPFFMQIAIDDVAVRGDTDLLVILALGFGAFALFNAGASILRAIALQQLTALLNWDMSQRLFRHMVNLPLPWFQARRLSDVLTRFQALESYKMLLSNGLLAVLLDGLLSVLTLVMMFLFAPRLALVGLAGVVFYALVRVLTVPVVTGLSAKALQAGIAEQAKRIETLRGIQDVKSMGGEAAREADWANRLADVVRTNQSATVATSGFQAFQAAVEALTNVVVIFLGVRAILAGNMTVGVLYAFISYRSQFAQRAVSVLEQWVSWRMLSVYSARLADVVSTPIEEDPPGALAHSRRLDGRIELRRVAFRYSPADAPVLSEVHATIGAGEFVAITGPSGCGKSTLLKMLCGLYPATAGEILFDGRPLSTWGRRAIRRQIGTVMQDDDLSPGSILENVTFYDDAPDLERVWHSLEVAQIAEEVRAMPMSLNTFTGDMGSALSGGQRQRILLARALYKQPRVLILDEATSHLDVPREQAINTALQQLKITRIVVAHRAETLTAADRLLVFQGGVLKEFVRKPAPETTARDLENPVGEA